MRYTRVLIAFVLTSALIFLFSFNVFASELKDLFVQDAWLYYMPNTDSNEAIYSNVVPTDNGDGTFTFALTEHINDNGNQTDLRSIAVLMYLDDGSNFDFEYGYIYTYNFTFTMTKVDDPDMYLEFGFCDASWSDAIPFSSVTYTYEYNSRQRLYQYFCTAVLYVDDNFSLGSLNDDVSSLCCYIDITGSWTGDLTLINKQQTVTKAIGEDAYYQASLDAINQLPQSEYNYIMSLMPDSEGEVELVQGTISDIDDQLRLNYYDSLSGFFTEGMAISRPVVYMPSIHIPILDIHVRDAGFFYIDDFLNSMNPNIMASLETLAIVIRWFTLITICTVTFYKWVRLDWWS